MVPAQYIYVGHSIIIGFFLAVVALIFLRDYVVSQIPELPEIERQIRERERLRAQLANQINNLERRGNAIQQLQETDSDDDPDWSTEDEATPPGTNQPATPLRNRAQRVRDAHPPAEQDRLVERLQQMEERLGEQVRNLENAVQPENAAQPADQPQPAAEHQEEETWSISEMFGITGNFTAFFATFVVVYVGVSALIGLLLWLPDMIGKIIVFLQYVPLQNAYQVFKFAVDPIIDPVAEKLATLFAPSVINASIANETVAAVVKEVVNTTLQNTTAAVNGTIAKPKINMMTTFTTLNGPSLLNLAFGYFILALAGYQYVKIKARPGYKSAIDRILKIITSGIVKAFKLCFFLTIELAIFPFFCGVLLDLCMLPVFGSTVASRITFHYAYPNSSRFLHWLVGTSFMYQFANYIVMTREVIRPGVLWFIRDPNDPDFHPVQDIMEKDILTQLQKLGKGTLMYSVVLLSTAGGFVLSVFALQGVFGVLAPSQIPNTKIFPLRFGYEYVFSYLCRLMS